MQDKLGQELAIGDDVIVASSTRNTTIGKITSMGQKMVVVKASGHFSDYKRYPSQVLKVGSGTESTSTVPEAIARTLTHALHLADGFIPTKRLEQANNWVNDLIWTKE